MCISKSDLDKKVAVIREYKSIKKDAETNLKPLEQEVKEFMEETNQTKYIGYGYSISYKEAMLYLKDRDSLRNGQTR